MLRLVTPETKEALGEFNTNEDRLYLLLPGKEGRCEKTIPTKKGKRIKRDSLR